jgi:hypothetical protein
MGSRVYSLGAQLGTSRAHGGGLERRGRGADRCAGCESLELRCSFNARRRHSRGCGTETNGSVLEVRGVESEWYTARQNVVATVGRSGLRFKLTPGAAGARYYFDALRTDRGACMWRSRRSDSSILKSGIF